MRIIFDTNVLISAALLRRSVSRQAFDRALYDGQILTSIPTLTELRDVLFRSRFDAYLTDADRQEFLAAFVRDAILTVVAEKVTECRDPKDNKFLELALSGEATHLVSGDKDLLVLHPFRGISILTPRDFLI